MDWNEYQQWALGKMKPSVRNDKRELVLNGALGLTGEAGEFADMVKKLRHHDHPFTEEVREKMIMELGDILFYVATAAASLGAELTAVAQVNIAKLSRRYPDGFDAERYLNKATHDRVDAAASSYQDAVNSLTEPERRKLFEGEWSGPERRSTGPSSDPATHRSANKPPQFRAQNEGANVEGLTMREIDEREGLIPTRLTRTVTSEAEPSVLGIGGELYDETFKNGYPIGGRVHRPWFKEGSGPGRRDSVAAVQQEEVPVATDAKPTPTSTDGRDLDGSGGIVNER